MDHVLHADEEAGEITVAQTDANGNVVFAGGQMLTEDIRGQVRIYLPATE